MDERTRALRRSASFSTHTSTPGRFVAPLVGMEPPSGVADEVGRAVVVANAHEVARPVDDELPVEIAGKSGIVHDGTEAVVLALLVGDRPRATNW